MKNTVVFDVYHQTDLKPDDLLRRYVDLLAEDVAARLAQGPLRVCGCPGCGAPEAPEAFRRFGLVYRWCPDCGSLYVSPRPFEEGLRSFLREAPSRIFWRQTLAAGTAEARRAKIIDPRWNWVADTVRECRPAAVRGLDLHTACRGYVEAFPARRPFPRLVLRAPLFPATDVPSPSGVERDDRPWWAGEPAGSVDVVTLFETLNHTADVRGLLRWVKDVLAEGGLCFLTTILAGGFDILVLGGRHDHLYPPDRLNVLTVEGLRRLVEGEGFEILELSTPGVLDVEIVARARRRDPDLPLSRFERALLEAPPHVREAFQAFLQEHRLSSYGRAVIRKP